MRGFMRIVLLMILLASLLISGCVDDSESTDPADSASEATLEYEGSQSGVENESAQCSDGDATLNGGGTIDDGTVTVTVSDGAGSEVFRRVYDDRWEFEGETLEGSGGDWTLSATRSTGFDGGYSFVMLCS